jgi:hypothetical protein
VERHSYAATLARTAIDARKTGFAAALLALLTACAIPSHGTQFFVGGGTLHVHGELAADSLIVEPGATLAGSGTIAGPTTVQGSLAPGSDTPGDSGVLSFRSSLAMAYGSTFFCHARSSTDLTRITASGAVTGTTRVSPSQAAGTIPLDQAIIQGGTGSALSLFALSPADALHWHLAPSNGVNLLLTDRVGDTNGNGIPDWWEQAHFDGRTNCSPSADGDLDGSTDGDEYKSLGVRSQHSTHSQRGQVSTFNTLSTWSRHRRICGSAAARCSNRLIAMLTAA